MSIEYQTMVLVMLLITMVAIIVIGINLTEKDMKNDEDKVNHPAHYEREDAVECIDEMQIVFGTIAVMHFCLCNVWKYRYRSADKNGAEDIAKSDWYMKKYLELKQQHKDELTEAWNNTPEHYDIPF